MLITSSSIVTDLQATEVSAEEHPGYVTLEAAPRVGEVTEHAVTGQAASLVVKSFNMKTKSP